MSEDNQFNPDLYLRMKSAGKVTLTRDAKGTVEMNYSLYDDHTGSVITAAKLIIDIADLNTERGFLLAKLAKIDEVLNDISRL